MRFQGWALRGFHDCNACCKPKKRGLPIHQQEADEFVASRALSALHFKLATSVVE